MQFKNLNLCREKQNILHAGKNKHIIYLIPFIASK